MALNISEALLLCCFHELSIKTMQLALCDIWDHWNETPLASALLTGMNKSTA